MTMSIEECVEVLEDMCSVDLTEREFEALSLAIQILSRLNEGFIENSILDYQEAGHMLGATKPLAQSLINSLIKEEE